MANLYSNTILIGVASIHKVSNCRHKSNPMSNRINLYSNKIQPYLHTEKTINGKNSHINDSQHVLQPTCKYLSHIWHNWINIQQEKCKRKLYKSHQMQILATNNLWPSMPLLAFHMPLSFEFSWYYKLNYETFDFSLILQEKMRFFINYINKYIYSWIIFPFVLSVLFYVCLLPLWIVMVNFIQCNLDSCSPFGCFCHLGWIYSLHGVL